MCRRGRRRERQRAAEQPWLDWSERAGWGGGDFTPQKCLNQENHPTRTGAGKPAVQWGRDRAGLDRAAGCVLAGPFGSPSMPGALRKGSFFQVVSDNTEQGL